MTHETFEEAAERYAEPYRCPATNETEYCRHDIISAINFGVKLAQERMYSEEDMKLAWKEGSKDATKGMANGISKKCYCTNEVYCVHCQHKRLIEFEEWFEHFKNGNTRNAI